MISPSRLDDDSRNLYEHQLHEFATNISPESRSPPRLFPRTPPGQAMAVSRGCCRGRVLWRPHMPIPCSLCHLMPCHVHPYPHGPPANVATLPAPINCTYSRPSGPFGLAEQALLFEHFFLFQFLQAGWERLQYIRF